MFNILRLNLQFFAADTGAGVEGGGVPVDTGQGGDQKTETVPPANQTPPAQPQQTQPEKQEQTNPEPPKVDTKEIKTKAQAELLKKLGFEKVDELQEVLTKYKEEQDAKKSEFELQSEKLQKIEADFSSVQTENESLRAQISAMKAGVKADAVEDVVVLAKTMVNDEVDMDAAIAKVLEKYPQFGQGKEDPEPEQKPSFKTTTGEHKTQPTTDVEKWLEAFKLK